MTNQIVTLFSGLTESELALTRAEFARFNCEIPLIASPFCWHSVVYYSIATQQSWFDEAQPLLCRVFERVRPIAACVFEEERFIVNTLRDILRDQNLEVIYNPDSPIVQICLRWEYRTVNVLLRRFLTLHQIDEWVDGFYPTWVSAIGNDGIKIKGHCYCGRASDASERRCKFVAVVELTEDHSLLKTLVLKFGDSFAMTADRVISDKAPDLLVDNVAGYRVTVQKEHNELAKDKRWAFQIQKGGHFPLVQELDRQSC